MGIKSPVIKSLNAAGRHEQRLWRLIRPLVPKRIGWFYEGCPGVPGQMWYADRRALYQTIRRYKPQIVCESGTWLGGGSTYFIASALAENGRGVLHTTEVNPEFYDAASQGYERHLSRLRPFVRFHFGESELVYPELLKTVGKVDALLLDGAEDGEQTFDEFHLFEPYLGSNSLVIVHDWNTEKMKVLRPYLEASPNWKLVLEVPPPRSVGFAVFQHRL